MRRRRAAILVLVLWALVLLALLAGGLSFVIGQDRRLGQFEHDRVIAHWLARAGVEYTMAEIMLDSTPATDSESESWADDENLQEWQLGQGAFSVIRDDYDDSARGRYGATDEAAKLNVNVASKEQLMKLPQMTASVAAAIIDWRDENEEPEPEGVERGHYITLPHPYTIRNKQFKTVRELLLVRGVTEELFWGEDTNANGRLDPNEQDGDTNPPADNGDGTLDRGWYAWLTVYSYEKNEDAQGNKRTNLKNADAATLASKLQLEPWAAESIVKRREQQEFKHLVDLLDVRLAPGVNRPPRDQDINSRNDNERDQPVTTSIFERIVDLLTLDDAQVLPGRVNINTAPLEVLKTLMPDEAAEATARQRQGGSSFNSIAELLRVTGMDKEKFGQIESNITVRSSVLRIYGEGRAASGISETIECVMDRGQASPKVLYWLQSSP